VAIDPLAQLADYDDQHSPLRSVAGRTVPPSVVCGQTLDDQDAKVRKRIEEESEPGPSRTCVRKSSSSGSSVWTRNNQLALLERFQAEGLNCCCKII